MIRALAALVGALAGALLLLTPSPAHADNAIAESAPAEGDTTTPQLTALTIRFENELAVAPRLVLVCEGNPVTTDDPSVGDDGVTVSTPITGALPEGDCVATWTTYDADNNEDASGELSFAVSASAAASTTTGADGGSASSESSTGGIRSASSVSSGPIWLGRVLSTIGISVLFGSLVLIVAAWPEGPEYVLALRFLRTTWIVGLVGTFIYVAALSAAVKGDSFGAGFNPGGWFDLFDAGWGGRAAVLRIVFVLACGWVVLRPERVIDPTTNMLALGIPAITAVTLALSRTGGPWPFLGVLASIAHVLAISVWFGGVVLLARVVLAGPGEEDLVHAVHGFARVSNPAIVVTVVSGLIQLYRLDGGELFTSGHGRLLLLKTLAVAAMIFVGLTARQVARARLARANELTARVADRMRRAFGTEAGIGVVVLLLTGWMMTFTPGKVADDGAGDWEETLTFIDPDSGLELDVLLSPARGGTPGQPVLNDLRVEVDSPDGNLSGLTLTFIPPEGGAFEIVQAIPELTGRGAAETDPGEGLPFDVAGTWQLQVSATTATGSAQNVTRAFEVRNADGSLVPVEDNTPPPIAEITVPEPDGPVLTDPPASATEPEG